MKIILSSGRRHYVARVSIFLITVALIAGMVGCVDISPPPSQNLEIRTWYDLDAVRNNLAGNHILMNDLDSATPGYEELASPTANGGRGWEPIGFWDGGTREPVFRGTFDGKGHEIRDLFINRPDEGRVGLFGVNGGGVIKDIGVTNATVIGGAQVGGLVGWNVVLKKWNVGTVSGSYFSGNITAEGPYGSYVGGLVGWNDGIVSDSFFSGSITAGGLCTGGLVGSNYGTVTNTFSASNVTGNGYVGGLVGWNGGSVNDSHFSGSVTGVWCVGGLVGSIGKGSTVTNSFYNYGEVLINGRNMITIGAMPDEDFEKWLANGKFLDVDERLYQEDGYYVVNNVSDFKQLLVFGQNSSLKFRLANDLDLIDEPDFYIPYLAGEFNGNGHRISNASFSLDSIYRYVGLFGVLALGGKVTQVSAESVNITGVQYVGCLVGWNEGTVIDCYATGTVIGGDSVGSLVGVSYGTVSECHFAGNVTGNRYIGGLVGANGGSVSNSYSICSVAGNFSVGGLVGENCGGTISNSYSAGSVSGSLNIGGLVGYSEGGTVTNSFWDTETSGQATSAGGTGRTTAQMKSITTFSGAGWNIVAVANPGTRNPSYIWNIVNGVTYPFLSWQPG